MNLLDEFQYLTEDNGKNFNINILTFKSYKDVPEEFLQPSIDLINALEKSMSVYNSEKITPNRNIKDALGENSLSIILKGKIVTGIIAYKLLNPDVLYLPGGHNVLYVSNLFVDSRFRGKGVGKLLMSHIEEVAKNLKAKTISLNVFGKNKKADSFYESLGFENFTLIKFKNI